MPLLSADLLDFIRSSVRSVWTLELLLLIKQRGGAWTLEALVQELRASDALVAECLASLQDAGLIRGDPDGGHVYAPAAPFLGALVEELEQAYRERPVGVVRAILSSPNEKLQSFANAFRLKDDPK